MFFLPHLHLLRSLAAVADTGSSQKAAALLYVAQSSVARAVTRLEEILGTPLFERTGRGMLPLGKGQQLALRSARALWLFAQADNHRNPRSPPSAWHISTLARGVGPRHILALQAIAALGNESRAAKQLGVSQSAVHQSLAQLEHLAGAALFVRSRHGLKLDDSGEAVLQATRLALTELRQADEEWRTDTDQLRGRLVVGTLPFSTAMLLPPAVEHLLAHEPAVHLVIVDGTYEALVQQLRRAEVDLIVGALRSNPPSDGITQEVLFDDHLAVIARNGHPLSVKKTKRLLRWADLQNASWVLPMHNTPAETALQQMLSTAGLPFPSDQVRTNSAMMMHAILANSDRLALMSPRQVAREIDAGLLTTLPLRAQHVERRIGVMQRRNYLPTPAATLLQDAFRAVAQTLQASSRP